MALVSFVVTCFNFENYIGECLKSVLGQEGSYDLEVIVIDDASADGSDAAIRAIGDSRIRYIHHLNNVGSVASSLEGIGIATGRYVARLDGDDRLRPNYLQLTVPLMERAVSAGMVYGNVAAMDREGKILEDPWKGIRSAQMHGGHDTLGDEYIALLKEHVAPACATLMRTSALRAALQGQTVSLFFDWFAALRVARTNRVAHVARTLADYRLHDRNLHRRLQLHPDYESTILSILDQIFAEPDHAVEKAQIRADIYAGTFIRFGDVRFGQEDFFGARARYLKAFGYRPALMLKAENVRHLIATYMRPEQYRSLKARLVAGSNLAEKGVLQFPRDWFP